VLPFIAAQIIGGIAATAIIKALYPAITPADAAAIVVPHDEPAARARTEYDGASPSADLPPGPIRPRG
jgi:glycerol uptake facilitator-like aquaporin